MTDEIDIFRGMLLNENGHPGGFAFLKRTARKGNSIFLGRGYDLHRNYGMVVILLSFLCNYDNLTLTLHQE